MFRAPRVEAAGSSAMIDEKRARRGLVEKGLLVKVTEDGAGIPKGQSRGKTGTFDKAYYKAQIEF